MQRPLTTVIAELLAVVGAVWLLLQVPKPTPPPAAPTPDKVQPEKRKPLLPRRDVGALQHVGGPEYQGTRVTVELPEALMMWNRGGSDGAGMCVMSSIEMAGLAQNVPGVKGLRDWCARERGGAHPPKVDDQLRRYYRQVHNADPPPYIQFEGRDVGAAMDLIDKTGRMACCTYGTSPRYGRRISHMVCSPLYRGQYGVCLDNNAIGGVKAGQRYEWVDKAEMLRRVCYPSGQGWVFVWLAPPPPPFLQPVTE